MKWPPPEAKTPEAPQALPAHKKNTYTPWTNHAVPETFFSPLLREIVVWRTKPQRKAASAPSALRCRDRKNEENHAIYIQMLGFPGNEIQWKTQDVENLGNFMGSHVNGKCGFQHCELEGRKM